MERIEHIELFTVALTEEGEYVAVRESSPFFCLGGKTLIECCQRAESALEFYRKKQHREL